MNSISEKIFRKLHFKMIRNLVSSSSKRALVACQSSTRTYISVLTIFPKVKMFAKPVPALQIPQRAFQFKNIYLQMDYKAPYSDTDLVEVLSMINTKPTAVISRYISKPKAELIVTNRPFEVVEQLLDLKGFSLKILENFVNKYLDENSSEAKVVTSAPVKDLTKGIKPNMNKNYLKANVSSIVALSFNLHSGINSIIIQWCM